MNSESVQPPGCGLPLHELGAAEAWIFDLDNTLYPSSARLFLAVDARIAGYIGDLLGVDPVTARRLQKEYFYTYGTTLRGLMTLHGVDPTVYMDYVHDVDLTPVAANPRLDLALAALPGRKIVFTNASVLHARRVMGRLGVESRFEDIYDIVAANYVPKPQIEAYRGILARYHLDASRCVMVEDMARNLEPAAALGITTVWLRNDSEWGAAGAGGSHVHHVAEDLAEWLELAARGETRR
jgi:putative hydrolase of the HAD superfamily